MKAPRCEKNGMLNMTLKRIKAFNGTNTILVANEISADMCLVTPEKCAPNNINIPVGCGVASEGTLTVASISKMVIPGVGSLIGETLNVAAGFDKSGLLFYFGNVEWNFISSE